MINRPWFVALLQIRGFVLACFILMGVNPTGFCQNVQQVRPRVPLITDEVTKKDLRQKLIDKYNPDPDKGQGRLLKIEDFAKDRKAPKSGGTWTGGGTGFACLPPSRRADSPQEMDSLGRLKIESYPELVYVEMLDSLQARSQDGILPAMPGESPLQYIERIVKLNFGRSAPLLEHKLLTQARLISEILNQQIQDYLHNPVPQPQLTLRDFGVDMLIKEKIMPQACRAVQMATRYARLGTYRIYDFFIDFDIALILRMRELAASPEQATVQEATLILHEAAYLLASAFEHRDSTATTFGFVPFILSPKTHKAIEDKTRGEAARWLRQQLSRFGFIRYHYLEATEADSENPSLGLISEKVPNLFGQVIAQADEDTLSQTKGLNFGSDYIDSFSRQAFENDPVVRKTFRESGIWKSSLVDQVASLAQDDFSFLVLMTLLEPEGDTLIDDLFLKSEYTPLAKQNLCHQLVKEKDKFFVEGAPNRSMTKIYNGAMRFCKP